MAGERPLGDWVLWVCGRDHHIGIEKGTPPWEMGLCPICETLDALAAAREQLDQSAGHTAEECEADAIQAEAERLERDLAAAREENERLREALGELLAAEVEWLEKAHRIDPDKAAGQRWKDAEDKARAALAREDGGGVPQ